MRATFTFGHVARTSSTKALGNMLDDMLLELLRGLSPIEEPYVSLNGRKLYHTSSSRDFRPVLFAFLPKVDVEGLRVERIVSLQTWQVRFQTPYRYKSKANCALHCSIRDQKGHMARYVWTVPCSNCF